MISYILAVVSALAVIGADRFTKSIFAPMLENGKSTEFIKGIIDITVVSNDGGAWGMLGGYTWLLVSITLVVMLVLFALLLRFGLKNKLMFWAIMMVLSGGIGNMIDRIFFGGKVIDFLHFEFWPTFPVFNVADCAIVLGAGLLILYFIIDIINDAKAKKAGLKEQDGNKGN